MAFSGHQNSRIDVRVKAASSSTSFDIHLGGRGRGFHRGRSGYHDNNESLGHKGDYEQKRVHKSQESQGHTPGYTHGSRGESHRGRSNYHPQKARQNSYQSDHATASHRGHGTHRGRSDYHPQKHYSPQSNQATVKFQFVFDQGTKGGKDFSFDISGISAHSRGGRGGSRGRYEKPYQGPHSDHGTKSKSTPETFKSDSSYHKPDSGRHRSVGMEQHRGRGRGHTGHHSGGHAAFGSTRGGGNHATRKRW